ncbi:MAG: redox-regulated ATPase YchF [Spirochaetales bacterium]|nr:redox-regulated ATPase YchF [Spirochaetales bacterium]
MGFDCGIIGLPNAGKSTIFNALSESGAQIANYPFCTIEPNRGVVPVPDSRLLKLGELLAKKNPIQTKIEFVDVAGLVKGASKGEGLGNKFLSHIRNVDALIHVVRYFHDEDVSHVLGTLDPMRDIDVINTELILSDLDILDRAEDKIKKAAKSGDKRGQKILDAIDAMKSHLNEGYLLKSMDMCDDMKQTAGEYGLVTTKPVLYLLNTDENDENDDALSSVKKFAEKEGSAFLTLKGKAEVEITELQESERAEYREALGIEESGLLRLIEVSYRLLSLITFYTITTDLQAWTVKENTTAPRAAGKIHTDFEHGFIRAEVIHYNDLIRAGSEHSAREMGLVRSEGKEYTVRDGDVIHFLFNV